MKLIAFDARMEETWTRNRLFFAVSTQIDDMKVKHQPVRSWSSSDTMRLPCLLSFSSPVFSCARSMPRCASASTNKAFFSTWVFARLRGSQSELAIGSVLPLTMPCCQEETRLEVAHTCATYQRFHISNPSTRIPPCSLSSATLCRSVRLDNVKFESYRSHQRSLLLYEQESSVTLDFMQQREIEDACISEVKLPSAMLRKLGDASEASLSDIARNALPSSAAVVMTGSTSSPSSSLTSNVMIG